MSIRTCFPSAEYNNRPPPPLPLCWWTQAQRQVAATVPRAYLSVTIDLYDAQSPCGAVHIRNKTAVGARLALGTLATMSRNSSSTSTASGPVPSDVWRWPTLTFAAVGRGPLSLRHVPGMTLAEATHCNVETTAVARPSDTTAPWTGWEPAESVSLQGGKATIIATNPSATVRGVRYAWGDVPSMNTSTAALNGRFLYDGEDLPMGVFIAECSPGPKSTTCVKTFECNALAKCTFVILRSNRTSKMYQVFSPPPHTLHV